MGFGGTLNIGQTGLNASQIAIQTAGNNIANAATPGFSRQTVGLAPQAGQTAGGLTLGRGVGVTGITREVDEAVLTRLRASVSDEGRAQERAGVLGQLEQVLNELTEFDLSTQLQTFFGAASDAANLVTDGTGLVGQGEEIAGFVRGMRDDLTQLERQIDQSIADRVLQADSLLDEVAAINGQISTAELNGGTANGLRDRRDQILQELSRELGVTPVENSELGTVDVFIGSTAVVLGSRSLGLELETEPAGDGTALNVRVRENGTKVGVGSGAVGGLLATREGEVEQTRQDLDTLATQLIFEVNKLHSTGTNTAGLSELTANLGVQPADQTQPINSTANQTFENLPFEISNGGFLVRVTDKANGTTNETRIDLDLDGIDSGGAASTIDDTTLADVVADLDAVAGISASFDSSGRVAVSADAGSSFSFGEDSSGLLAAIGLGGFFTGNDASDIEVAGDLRADPSSVRLGRVESDGTFNENGTALAISDLSERAVDGLDGLTFERRWSNTVQRAAVASGLGQTEARGATAVRESLEAQRAAVSGVSVDEETIDLISFQRQFQGAARVISIADELLDTLIAIV